MMVALMHEASPFAFPTAPLSGPPGRQWSGSSHEHGDGAFHGCGQRPGGRRLEHLELDFPHYR